MMTVAQKSPDYTTRGVPDVVWWTENRSGTSPGNDTNRECDRTRVYEKSIFSEKLGGFENYTCSGVTRIDLSTPETFFAHCCIGTLFEFIPVDIIR